MLNDMNSPSSTSKTSTGSSPTNNYYKIKPFIINDEGTDTDHHHDNDINDEMTIIELEKNHHSMVDDDREVDSHPSDGCSTLKSYVTPSS